MKSHRLYLGVVLLMLAILLIYGQRSWSQQTSPVPFTVVKVTTMWGKSGQPPSQMTHTIAHRRDGALFTFNHDEKGGITTLFLPTRKLHVTTDPTLKNKSTRPVDRPLAANDQTVLPYSGDKCSAYLGKGYVLYGSTQVLGVEVYSYGNNFDAAESRYLNNRHLAPTLNCFEMLEDYTWKDDKGVTTARTIEKVESLTMGDPDPRFFEIPETFTEVLPSVLHSQHYQLLGRTMPECAVERYKRSDTRYLKARAGIR